MTLRFLIKSKKSKKLKTRVIELIKFNKFGIYIYIYIKQPQSNNLIT